MTSKLKTAHFTAVKQFVALLLLTAPLLAGAADLLRQGDDHWAAGRLEQAAAAYNQAISVDPKAVEARMRLAGLHLSRQEYAEAVPLFQQAISIDASNDRAFIGLAITYLHMQKTLMAQAALEEALGINPARREALEPLIASIRERSGSMDSAHPSMPGATIH